MLITCTTVAVADNNGHIDCLVMFNINSKHQEYFKTSEFIVTVHVHYITTVPWCSQLQYRPLRFQASPNRSDSHDRRIIADLIVII